MNAIQIINELKNYGASVFLDGGALKLGINNDLPDGLIERARACKAELISLLSGNIKKYPAVWQVQLRTGERVYSMTVIDPDRMPDDQFILYLNEKFGAGRVVSAKKRFNSSYAVKCWMECSLVDD